jgi:hypothetical protein
VGHVFIDESGWGCPVGGMTICIVKEWGNKEYHHIPVKLFQYPMNMKEISEAVWEHVWFSVNNICALNIDTFHVCRGPIMKFTRKMLSERDLRVDATKIVGVVQMELEEKNCEILRDTYGVPVKKLTGHGGRSFKWYIDWLKEDSNRMSYAKTGWKGLERWLK